LQTFFSFPPSFELRMTQIDYPLLYVGEANSDLVAGFALVNYSP
jgi:hypothetical protein